MNNEILKTILFDLSTETTEELFDKILNSYINPLNLILRAEYCLNMNLNIISYNTNRIYCPGFGNTLLSIQNNNLYNLIELLEENKDKLLIKTKEVMDKYLIKFNQFNIFKEKILKNLEDNNYVYFINKDKIKLIIKQLSFIGSIRLIILYDNTQIFMKNVCITNLNDDLEFEIKHNLINNFKTYIINQLTKNINSFYNKKIVIYIDKLDTLPYKIIKSNKKITILLNESILFNKQDYDIIINSLTNTLKNEKENKHKICALTNFLNQIFKNENKFIISDTLNKDFDIENKLISINFNIKNKELREKFIELTKI